MGSFRPCRSLTNDYSWPTMLWLLLHFLHSKSAFSRILHTWSEESSSYITTAMDTIAYAGLIQYLRGLKLSKLCLKNEVLPQISKPCDHIPSDAIVHSQMHIDTLISRLRRCINDGCKSLICKTKKNECYTSGHILWSPPNSALKQNRASISSLGGMCKASTCAAILLPYLRGNSHSAAA